VYKRREKTQGNYYVREINDAGKKKKKKGLKGILFSSPTNSERKYQKDPVHDPPDPHGSLRKRNTNE
jgi:hypothetical protein